MEKVLTNTPKFSNSWTHYSCPTLNRKNQNSFFKSINEDDSSLFSFRKRERPIPTSIDLMLDEVFISRLAQQVIAELGNASL